jgi:hypothetical protein
MSENSVMCSNPNCKCDPCECDPCVPDSGCCDCTTDD